MRNGFPTPKIILPQVLIGEYNVWGKAHRRKRSRLKIHVSMSDLAKEAVREEASRKRTQPAKLVKDQHIPLFIQQVKMFPDTLGWFKDVIWVHERPHHSHFHNKKHDQITQLFVHQDNVYIFTGSASYVDFSLDIIHEADDDDVSCFRRWT